MSQQDIKDTNIILIRGRLDNTFGGFFCGFCGLGNPEFTKDINKAKLMTALEAVKIQLKLKDKGYIIFADNYTKYLPIEEI